MKGSNSKKFISILSIVKDKEVLIKLIHLMDIPEIMNMLNIYNKIIILTMLIFHKNNNLFKLKKVKLRI